mmetsp:Transcript_1075/g.2287  ORF Transcript_1075/g.2287 Transcript_1075/m.2287 type:complete len:249 (-) Transcript_1075:201-947(-)
MEFLPQIPSTLWITSMMNVLQMDSHAIKRNACGGNGNSFVTTPPVAPTKHKIWKSSSLLTTTDITPTHNSTWPWLETVARFSLIPQDIFEPFSGSVTRITTRKTDPSSWTCVCPGIRTTSLSSLIPMGMVLYRETRDTWKFIEREIWFNGSSRLAAPLLWILQGFPSPGPRRNQPTHQLTHPQTRPPIRPQIRRLTHPQTHLPTHPQTRRQIHHQFLPHQHPHQHQRLRPCLVQPRLLLLLNPHLHPR